MPVCKMNKFFDFLFSKLVWTADKNKIEFLDELSDQLYLKVKNLKEKEIEEFCDDEKM